MRATRDPLASSGSRWRGELKRAVPAVVFCLIWSGAFVAAKFGLRSSPPLTLAALRFLVAGPLMLAFALVRRDEWPHTLRAVALLALLGLLSNAIYLGLSFMAMRSVTAGLMAVIASTNPLLTALLAYFALRERLSWKKVAGLALGLGGVVYIMRNRATMQTDAWGGIALAVAGVGSFVLAAVLFKRYLPRQSLLVVNGTGVTAAAVALLPVALVAERGAPVVYDATFFLALSYLALAASIGGTLLWFYLLRSGTASRASAYHFLNPGLGLVMGWLALGEPLLWPDLWGLLPITAGIGLVTRSDAAR